MRRICLALGCALLLAACTAPSTASDPERTAPLPEEAWEQSAWISAADAPVIEGPAGMRSADGASWFLSTVQNRKKVVKAVWMTTGLGVYDLYVNGQLIGNEVLKPGFTHYAKTKRSFTYDISGAFRKGAGEENTLSAQVTPGWWADKIVTPGGHEGMIGRKCAFRGVLALTYADGKTEWLGTDLEHWHAGIAGPVQHAGIFDGEEYDARRLPGFQTPELLGTPEINMEFAGEILPSEGAEVYHRTDLALAPVQAYVWEGITGWKASEDPAKVEHGTVAVQREYAAGQVMELRPGETLVADFGQNAAAVPSFVFKAAEGTVLTALFAEILNDGNGAESRGMDGPQGSIHRRNLRMGEDMVRVLYTFGPSGDWVAYCPRTTFFGYRFISITATAPVQIQKLESIPVTSISKEMETGTLETGNEDINRLISNTIWGMRSNYLSVPTDCPQRDERLGWMADTQVFAGTASFFADTRAFFRKWTRDVRDSQSEAGAYPGVSPVAQYGGEYMRLGWADAGIIVPWTVWKQFGDQQIVDENWDSMERFMDYVNATRYRHEAHLQENHNYQWADWLSYEPLESCTNRHVKPGTWEPLPAAVDYWNYLSACYWCLDARMMRDMARDTGREQAYEKYDQMAETAWEYIRETFLNGDGSFRQPILNTMQTPALFGLKTGVMTEESFGVTVSRLAKNIADHQGCLQTGFLGTSILMNTLTECYMEDVAYGLLFQRQNPSWLYSIDNGATTIWERWNSYRKDSGLGPVGMNSFNHYAYGSVCQWLWEKVAGMEADPYAPGFRHFYLHPVPDRRLGYMKAEYRSAAGLVRSAWRYEGELWIWEFTVPEGTSATVVVPGGEEEHEYGPGTYEIRL